MISKKMEGLIIDLVDATYDTGYYSGQKKDGSDLHKDAIKRRELARIKLKEEISFQLAGWDNASEWIER